MIFVIKVEHLRIENLEAIIQQTPVGYIVISQIVNFPAATDRAR
jgi:predicted transcriptional regulator